MCSSAPPASPEVVAVQQQPVPGATAASAATAAAAASTPSPLPLGSYSNGREAVAHISQVFHAAAAAQRAGRTLDVGTVVSAGQATAFLYPVIFGHGSLVASILTRITSRHCSQLHQIATSPGTPAEARVSLKALLTWEATALQGKDPDRFTATHAALWIMRVLDFIQDYLSIMCGSDQLPPSVCARTAYDAKLAPYHGECAGGPRPDFASGTGTNLFTPTLHALLLLLLLLLRCTHPSLPIWPPSHPHCPCPRLHDQEPGPHCPVVRAQ
jgi:hypothetical protein